MEKPNTTRRRWKWLLQGNQNRSCGSLMRSNCCCDSQSTTRRVRYKKDSIFCSTITSKNARAAFLDFSTLRPSFKKVCFQDPCGRSTYKRPFPYEWPLSLQCVLTLTLLLLHLLQPQCVILDDEEKKLTHELTVICQYVKCLCSLSFV